MSRLPFREPRLVELGTEIVVIEDEGGSVKQPEEEPDRPEHVWRVAGLDDRKTTSPARFEAQSSGWRETSRRIQRRRRARAAWSVGPVLVNLDFVDPGVGGVARCLGAHNGDLEPSLDQRLALEPHASIERNRQVLHNDQDPAAACDRTTSWSSRSGVVSEALGRTS